MNIDLQAIDRTSTIQAGYAAVSLLSAGRVPSNLLHGSYMVPRYVKRDLHSKIKTALEDSGLAKEGNVSIQKRMSWLHICPILNMLW